MSNESWLKEYYPVKANKGSKENAINHSLNKWIGLLPENLQKHNINSPPILIEASTCSLCYHYFDETDDNSCSNCPLCITREDTPCDCCNMSLNNNTEHYSPYRHYQLTNNPQPMIYWLTKTKEDTIK